ncbi:MAG: hypothetical protein WBG86_01860 [Polyangiales bacterium]
MGIPLALRVELAAVADEEPEGGIANLITSSLLVVPVETVDLLLDLSCSFVVSAIEGLTTTSIGSEPLPVTLTPVPCLVCAIAGTSLSIVANPASMTLDNTDGDVELTLDAFRVEFDASGFILDLSTSGDEPACTWSGGNAPTVSVRLNSNG